MSEAWAKMHLRDYVRSDDIDNAIEMLLDSFLQSQKNSVARQLAKKFEKYRVRQQDPSQLLLHTLKKVVSDRAQYEKIIKGVDATEKISMTVPVALLQNEVRDFATFDLNNFFQSPVF